MKPLYGLLKAENHWFATYYIYHKEKLKMTKSIYNPCLFIRSKLLGIMEMQTNDTLILVDNNFASIKEEAIKSIKIMTKDRKYLILIYSLKFNGAQIKLDSNGIILTKKSYIRGILLVINHATDSISFKKITKKKLSLKE